MLALELDQSYWGTLEQDITMSHNTRNFIIFSPIIRINNANDATIWCLFLTAFFLIKRKSNLVPNSAKNKGIFVNQ
jgi:hypothetical protein